MNRLLFSLMLLITMPVRADEAAAILARVDQYRSPIDSFVIDVDLTSFSGDRSESSRFRVYGKGTDRSVVEFVAPASEKGKYLLMLRDAMWIYLPSASRPLRISPLQRLMGQASNGDVARAGFAVDYHATGVSEEDVDGKRAWVLDLAANDPAIAYSRVRLWVDRAGGEPLRADFYVISGKLIKRAYYREFGVMSGRRAITGVEIEDLLRKGDRTIMRYSNLAARDNPDKMFTRDSIGKW